MKIISISVDETLLNTFKEQGERDSCTVPQILRAAITSYAAGDLVVCGPNLISRAIGHVPRVTPTSEESHEKRSPGRPKLYVNKERLAWYEGDHSKKAIWDFKMPRQPHVAVDPLPHMLLETRGAITGKEFEDTLNDEYDAVRESMTYREWEGKSLEFLSCCAMKFLTLNREEHLRFEEDTIAPEFYAWRENMEQLYVASQQAQGKEVR